MLLSLLNALLEYFAAVPLNKYFDITKLNICVYVQRYAWKLNVLWIRFLCNRHSI